MIWLGRLISLPLGVVFFALLLVTLVLIQVSNTFLDPDFYPSEMRKADVYEFALDELLTTFIDEARAKDAGFYSADLEENPFITAGLTTKQIVSSIRRAVSPEWVQGLVEQSFDQIGRYVTGERAEFAVNYKAGERAVTLVGEIKSLLREADAYNLLYQEVVTPAVDDAVTFDLPLGLEVSNDRIVEAIQTVASPVWVRRQVESTLDAVTPYFLGAADGFEVWIRLGDRAEIAVDETKRLLRETDAYELLYDQVVAPSLLSALGGGVELPFDLTVTDEEVLDALRKTAPLEWVQEQAERIVDDATPYLVGETDRFSTLISLADNKREAEAVIVELVDTRLTDTLERRLPPCGTSQLREALSDISRGSLPSCVPPQIPVADLVKRIGVDVTDLVTELVFAPLPDEIRFTEIQIKLALSAAGAEENIDRIDEVREILRDGWTYTDADLREDIFEQFGQDGLDNLEDVRGFLKDGVSYSSQELQTFRPIFGQRPRSDAV